MFKVRLISGIGLIIIALLVIITGSYLLSAFLGILSLIGMYEFLRIKNLQNTILAYASYILCVIYYLLISFINNINLIIPAVTIFIILSIIFVILYPKYTSDELIFVYFSFIYIGLMFSFIYKLRMFSYGNWLVWLIFIGAWGCDTLAYCFGMLFGKHKLVPILSPKKTIEGAVGGIIGAVILSIIYAVIMKNVTSISDNILLKFILITFVTAIMSEIGDLLASGIKRNNDIKDYGNIIPGHGGILDRFDSILFVSPVVYFLTVYLF